MQNKDWVRADNADVHAHNVEIHRNK